MAPIPEQVRSAVTAGRLAHLVTLNPDGSPQITCVWVGIDGDDLVTGHMFKNQKIQNVQRDPRVALSIETDQMDPSGMLQYLVVHGTARVAQGGAPRLLGRLARVYLGLEDGFPPMPNPPEGYVLHITPERYGGMGPWGARYQ